MSDPDRPGFVFAPSRPRLADALACVREVAPCFRCGGKGSVVLAYADQKKPRGRVVMRTRVETCTLCIGVGVCDGESNERVQWLWETLATRDVIPLEWAHDASRWFDGHCQVCRTQRDPSRSCGRCFGANIQKTHPATAAAAIALASCRDAVTTAEAISRELTGADVVTWRVAPTRELMRDARAALESWALLDNGPDAYANTLLGAQALMIANLDMLEPARLGLPRGTASAPQAAMALAHVDALRDLLELGFAIDRIGPGATWLACPELDSAELT